MDSIIVLSLSAFLTLLSLLLIGYTNPLEGLYNFLVLLQTGNANNANQSGFDFTVQFSTLVRLTLVLMSGTLQPEVADFFFSQSAALVFFVVSVLSIFLLIKISSNSEGNMRKSSFGFLMLCLILPCISIPPNYAYRLAWFIPIFLLFAEGELRSYLLPDLEFEKLVNLKTFDSKKKKASRKGGSFQYKPLVIISLLSVATPFLFLIHIHKYGDFYSLSILGIFYLILSLRRN
jgi:hypothetical protein